MVYSMTGFGNAEDVTGAYSLKVEIRALNSKFFDPIIKIPKEFLQWEIDIKSTLEKGLKRGKANLSIEFVPNSFQEAPIHINEKLFELYYKKYKEMARQVNSSETDLFKLALHSPNVVIPKDDENEWIDKDVLLKKIEEAIERCNEFRKEEGKELENALQECCNAIDVGLQKVKELDPGRLVNIRNRLTQSITEIKTKVGLDENRFEQELVYYVEKLDISEEKVRLASHLSHFMQTIHQEVPNGKKLGFISQEIGREINTIGSKANDAGVQREVVAMKEELEKIKEQVLNIL